MSIAIPTSRFTRSSPVWRRARTIAVMPATQPRHRIQDRQRSRSHDPAPRPRRSPNNRGCRRREKPELIVVVLRDLHPPAEHAAGDRGGAGDRPRRPARPPLRGDASWRRRLHVIDVDEVNDAADPQPNAVGVERRELDRSESGGNGERVAVRATSSPCAPARSMTSTATPTTSPSGSSSTAIRASPGTTSARTCKVVARACAASNGAVSFGDEPAGSAASGRSPARARSDLPQRHLRDRARPRALRRASAARRCAPDHCRRGAAPRRRPRARDRSRVPPRTVAHPRDHPRAQERPRRRFAATPSARHDRTERA